MNIDGQAMFIGALYVVDAIDSIGVPVFGIPGGNTAYVAEMNADFRITEFLDFHNFEGFLIEYNIPEAYKTKIYSLGDPTPIPFWIKGICHVIEGDAESNDIFKIFGPVSIDNPVLVDLRRYLADARFGFFQEQFDKWTVDDISNAFADVFREPPIHSRYWVTRLGDAVRHARSITEPPHPIDNELRRVALDWIERFATKTDFDRIMAVVGHLLTGSITSDRAQAMIFAFLVNKIQTGNFDQIEKRVINTEYFDKLFPNGLYHYWVRNDWPRLNFNYKKPQDLLDPLMAELARGLRKENFIRAERMSFLLFRRDDAPYKISDEVIYIKEVYINKLQKAKTRVDNILYDRSHSGNLHDRAKYLLYIYHILMALDGIIMGEMRMSREIVNNRFGMDSYYINQLEDIVGLS